MKIKSFATLGSLVLTATVLVSVKPASAATLNVTGNVLFTPTSFTTGVTNPVDPAQNIGFPAASSLTIQPISATTPVPIPNFITFNNDSGESFTLNSLPSVVDADVPGGATSTVSVFGTFAGPVSGPGTGIFTAQFAGITAAQLAATSSTSTYSASFITTAAVPEPSEVAGTVALGILGAVFAVSKGKRFNLFVKS